MKDNIEYKENSGVQLITYADSLGNNLNDLKYVLDTHLKSVVKGVHILPFYPSSGDRGFAPLTHRKIDPAFGRVEDLSAISADYNLMADLIVNHVSKESKYFQDYLAKGDRSKYHNFFINARYFSRRWYKRPKSKLGRFFYFSIGQIVTIMRNLDFIFHEQGVNRLILKKIYRPRPGSPFVKFIRADGSKRYLWCTFSPEQIDLNIKSLAVRRKFRRDIRFLETLGVKYLRLDAVAYAGKQRSTNSFLIPRTYIFIKWLARHAHHHGMKVVPEVHFHYKTQISLAHLNGVDYVYDFALPFLMLNALFSGRGQYLKNWFKIRPQNSISNLDTHDGIGVVDVEDLLPPEEIQKTTDQVYRNGGNAATRASGSSSVNVDVYQINCTYYSALDKNDKAYLLARAIQLFLPGIPQIYYVGLFVGANDKKLLNKTKNGRDVNRHYYTLAEIEQEKEREVVKKLFKLCKLRNSNPVFRGKYKLDNTSENIIGITWRKNGKSLSLKADLETKSFEIRDELERTIFSV
ncbi:MAG: sucrose phosphorylase [Patescibacteria group bacterium]|jgi:sucrose phosphorylase|nr:sucrose phosphorylase [Patescibacteria group bacterium]